MMLSYSCDLSLSVGNMDLIKYVKVESCFILELKIFLQYNIMSNLLTSNMILSSHNNYH